MIISKLKRIPLSFKIRANIFFRKHFKTTIKNKLEHEFKGIPNCLHNDDRNACIIVFSKDRAIQAHAMIESYFRQVTNKKPVTILYTYSSKEHQKSYNELISLYSENAIISFCLEKHFKKDLIRIVKKAKAEKILLGCDDVIFSKNLDLDDFCKINPKYAIGSLLRGMDVNFCLSTNRKLKIPYLYDFHNDTFLKNKLVWKWDSANESHWAYPLALGFHLFDKSELLFILKHTLFKLPNSLEGGLQVWLPYFKDRFGISYKNTSVSDTPINLVNVEVINHISGGYTSDELLVKWNEGYRIKFEEFDNLDFNEGYIHKISFVHR